MSLYYSKFLRSFVKKYIGKERIPYSWLEQPFWYGRPDTDAIRTLKDKYKGQRCFILGNGPSLNQVDFELLKSEYSFAVNGIFYKTDETGYVPTFYVVEDSHVMKDNVQRINDYDAPHKFFSVNYRSDIKNRKNTYFLRMDEGFYVEHSPNYCMPRFSADPSLAVYCGQSVTMVNLQLAYYLGFEKVYLIGMDFNYHIPSSADIDGNNITSTEDDVNHFHPDYFGKGKKWHDPKLDRVMKSYQLMKLVFEADGREIINATHGGKLELFRRQSFESLFKND